MVGGDGFWSDPGSTPAPLELFPCQDCNCGNNKSYNPGDMMPPRVLQTFR